VPVAAFLAVGAVAVWSAVGFGGGGAQTGVSFADGADGQRIDTSTNAAPITNQRTVPSPTFGSDAGGFNGGTNSGDTNNGGTNSGDTNNGGSDSGSDDGPARAEQTKYGPLTAADKDFLDKVWQAGSWEGPTGRQAQERAGSQRVKDVGLTLASDHAQLDAKVTAVAQQLGHTLPTKPSAQQQGWMDQLSQVEGEEYDRLFADLLRAAHGKVFAVVADIRAGTKNGLVRSFAQTANAAVLKHMTILESTGMVDFSKLPDSKPPAAAPAPGASSGTPARPGANNSGTGNSPGSLPTVDPSAGPAGAGQGLTDDPSLTNTAANQRPQGGLQNYIVVIMLALTGVISAVAYRQLHRRRR
jgi:predicted outer membrane protein